MLPRSLPFVKALRTVKINRMVEDAVATQGNQVIETNITNMVDSRIRLKIITVGNFNKGVLQPKVVTSLENLEEVPFPQQLKTGTTGINDFDTFSS